MHLASPAFEHHQPIPKRYTCQGEDINPPLNISNIPKEAKSLLLIIDDPDAPSGTWDHWIVWNIPPTSSISENTVPIGAVQGKNSWGKNRYGGPCPPTGAHRYFFKLYALNIQLTLSPDTPKQELLKHIEEHKVGYAELVGTYQKGKN